MPVEMLEELRRNVREGTLKLASPGPILLSQSRPIFMAVKLHDEIFGPSAEDADRMGFLEADLARFIDGEVITIARGKEGTCNFKPLSPSSHEVWEIRSRDPDPSIRIFGRFAFQDVFIATNLAYRTLLGGLRSRGWAREIAICKATWTHLFPYLHPHSGDDISDYISSNFIDLDKIP
jgi:hypothetical protein